MPSVFWFTYICILKILSRAIHQTPNIFFLEFHLCEKVFYLMVRNIIQLESNKSSLGDLGFSMMLVLRRKWDFEGDHNFSSWSAKWIENDISSMHFDCKNENNWKYFIIHLILSQKCTRSWGFPSHYCLLGKMEDNQISDWEDSNIYRLQNICLSVVIRECF